MSLRTTTLALLACGCLTVTVTATASAAPGDLDGSFGDHGYVYGERDAMNADLSDLVSVPDGVIALAGAAARDQEPLDWTVRKLDESGQAAADFGVDGVAATPAEWRLSSPTAEIIDRSGSLVVVGGQLSEARAYARFAIVRYLPDGTPDSSFSGDGLQTVRLAKIGGHIATAVAQDASGGYLVAGIYRRGATGDREPSRGAVVRLNPDGSRDASFGDRGAVRLRTNGTPWALARDERGRIMLAFTGPPIDSHARGRVVLMRFTRDNALDRSFGQDGRSRLRLGGRAIARGLTPAGDRMLLATDIERAGETRAALLRLKLNGELDRGFGRRGLAFIPERGGRDTVLNEVVTRPDGRITGAGFTGPTSSRAPMAVRLTKQGKLDRRFGDRGFTILKAAPRPSGLVSIVNGPNQTIYLGGAGGPFRGGSTFTARLLG